MDDGAPIPWWLLVLLGIGVTGLAVWQSSRGSHQWRMGAGALVLIYLAMLAWAVGGDPRGSGSRHWSVTDCAVIGLRSVSIIAATLLSGRPALRGQLVWFAVLSLANAATCFVVSSYELGTTLAAVAVMSMGFAAHSCRSGASPALRDLWPQPAADAAPAMSWLAGAVGFTMAVACIGTAHFALSIESTRATPSRRSSALPSRDRVRALLSNQDDRTAASRGDRTWKVRPDILALLAVLAFVTLAAARSGHTVAEPANLAQATDVEHPPPPGSG